MSSLHKSRQMGKERNTVNPVIFTIHLMWLIHQILHIRQHYSIATYCGCVTCVTHNLGLIYCLINSTSK